MSSKNFRIESTKQNFGLLGSGSPYSENIDGLLVYEVYEDPEEDSNLGLYQVVIEAEVENQDELENKSKIAIQLAEDFEVLWPYVWIMPLHGKSWDTRLSLISPPEGWGSNKKEIRKKFDIENGGLTFDSLSFINVDYLYSNMLPLERAIRIRKKYLKADAVIKTLIELNFESHNSKTIHSRLFLLAKAMEITRAHLKGNTDQEREENLPEKVRSQLNYSYHHLFNLANSRIDTRHAVRKKGEKVELHPKMDSEELNSFMHDCDLIIRSVVCSYFDEEVTIVGGERKAKGTRHITRPVK